MQPIHVIDFPTRSRHAPVVVLVHGTRDSSESFQSTAELLSDLHVVLYDRRGQGRSRAVPPAQGFDDHVEDLLSVIGERHATIVGHSWGGHVALATAIRRPDLIRTVGVFETSLVWFDWWSAETRTAVLAFSARGWKGADPDDLAQMRAEVAMIQQAPYDLTLLKVPCAMAYGADSRPSEVSAILHASEIFDATTVALEGVTHYAHRSNPASFAGFVRRVVGLEPLERHATST